MTGQTIARRSALGLLAGAATLVVSGCGLLTSRGSYRVRVTLDAGRERGSGVWQINASKSVALTAHEHAGGAGITGEAVVIDLPDGPVFALLTIGDGKPLLATRTTLALVPGTKSTDPGAFLDAVDQLGDASEGEVKAELPRADWPMMVRFDDIKDPKTVEQVDPDALGIKRIVLETTNADVTTGIEQRLGWLGKYWNQMLNGDEIEWMNKQELSAHLGAGSLSTFRDNRK